MLTILPRVKDYYCFGVQLISGWRARHEQWIANLRRVDLASVYNGQAGTPTVLDLANGRLRPQYRILRARGCRVYGIDVANHPVHQWQDHAYKCARWLYARGLDAKSLHPEDTLVCGDVARLPFRSESFDVITSVAAFEHFLNVPEVVQELYRVIKPGGLVWVLVHLFSSPSGGHNINLSQVPLYALPQGVDPWDHLRKRQLPFRVPLNQWRRDQYLSEFNARFEILKHYCAMREGEHFLTTEIQKELSDYSRDELTCGAYVIMAQKQL